MEILVAIGAIATVATILILTLNPSEILRRSRDSQRLSDMDVIGKSLSLYTLERSSAGSLNTVYISIPDSLSTCANLTLPPLDLPWSYRCATSANYTNVDGSGWIPIDLTSLSFRSPISHFPVDPVNSDADGLFYSYVVGSWKISARLEALKNVEVMKSDGGIDETRFEKGTNLSMGPVVSGTPPPTVTAISPSSGQNDASVSVSFVAGTNFESGAAVRLVRSGESNINCSGFGFTSPTQLSSGTCPITGAAAGAWDVVVVNPNLQSGALSAGFTVIGVQNIAFDTSASGANAEGGSCAGSLAWDHGSICVRVPSGVLSGSQPSIVTSDSRASNANNFTVP